MFLAALTSAKGVREGTILPHLSTSSLMNPWNISILPFRISTVSPCFSWSNWSEENKKPKLHNKPSRAVKTMAPEASATIAKPILILLPSLRTRSTTVSISSTFTLKWCPSLGRDGGFKKLTNSPYSVSGRRYGSYIEVVEPSRFAGTKIFIYTWPLGYINSPFFIWSFFMLSVGVRMSIFLLIVLWISCAMNSTPSWQ